MITKIQHILFNISEYKLTFISTNIIVTAAIYWGDTIPSILKTYHLILKSTPQHYYFCLCFKNKDMKALIV